MKNGDKNSKMINNAMEKKLDTKFEIRDGERIDYIERPKSPENDPYPMDSRTYGLKPKDNTQLSSEDD